MSCLSLRQALWALAVFSTLAPSLADGNIGCLFSSTLCIGGVETCYDDFAFGKCVAVNREEQDEDDFYRYDMTGDQLLSFEAELQQLLSRGYRWEHAFTQCILQAMLYSMKENIVIGQTSRNICDRFIDPKLESEFDDSPEAENQQEEADAEETAYIRFTPNSPAIDSDFANEIYSPPVIDFENLDQNILPLPVSEQESQEGDLNNDLDKYLLMKDDDTPLIIPFMGFRERLQSEDNAKNLELHPAEKEKKSIPSVETLSSEKGNEQGYLDEERLGAHFRKLKTKVPPYTAEYITENKASPLDDEVRSNALEKYKQSFAAKNFPFEYENPDNEIPENRIYLNEDTLENYPFGSESGELEDNYFKDTGNGKEYQSKNMQYLIDYWKMIESKLKPPRALYAEGGPFKSEELHSPLDHPRLYRKRVGGVTNTNDVSGENSKFYPEELQGLLYNEWGFKRRERDDVKKPGPHIDAKVLRLMRDKNVTEHSSDVQKQNEQHHNHNDFEHDPSFAYVQFKNRFATEWDKGIAFISRLEALLGLEKNTLTNPRVAPNEVSFKVEKNSKGLDAAEVARKVDDIKDELRRQTGAQIVATGIGDQSKLPVIRHAGISDNQLFGMEFPVFLALAGSLSVLLIGSLVFAILLKKDLNAKRKMHGLASAAQIDAEATNDYQELCRARMSGKWTGQTANTATPGEGPQRITSLSKESENSHSTRSSTSSWSEEPALTNMDISTGHMVLAYMEDHLRNKDRLEQEWRALCAYEAEPCATTAALKKENSGKNRYTDVLPYDHSRVTLNMLSNHLGSDYINASTITDHDPRNPAYIAAAGPLAQTAPDFWQMVWEQGSVVMVMLTRLTENGQQLCHRYWPEEGSELYHIYEAHLVSEHIWCDDYLIRSFYLKNQRTGETRTVTQFHFLSWPENGVPSSTKALLEFRRKVNKSYRGRSCPIIVHCSDGAGRSGTYCLIDMVLNRMAKGAKEIDIAATLEHIRDQRPRTVATKQQFEFVLMAVAEEVHAILKALPAHLQQQQEKKDKEKENEALEKEKPN